MAAGDAGHPVAGEETMIVAGLGCRKGAAVEEIEAALAAAIAAYASGEPIGLVATERSKADEPGIVETARRLSARLVAFSTAELEAVSGGIITRSERVLRIKGVHSIAEAAALAAAGRNARLLGPRVANAAATCALAIGDGS
jgi:cobalamin biosynthesis protein CbiG